MRRVQTPNTNRLARNFAKNRGLQLQLAKDTGISQSWLSQLANGRGLPNLAHAQLLAKHGYPLDGWAKPCRQADRV